GTGLSAPSGTLAEPAPLQRLQSAARGTAAREGLGGAASEVHRARIDRVESLPHRCVGKNVLMARQVRPALPEPGYHKDHREGVKVQKRKSADSSMAQRAVSLQERRRIYACSRTPDGHQHIFPLQSGVGPYMR